MISQQSSEIWANVFKYLQSSILLLFSLIGLIIVLVCVKMLLDKLHVLKQQEIKLCSQLQDAHKEQEVLEVQRQELLDELKRLEQVTVVMTDTTSGLPNQHAIMSRLDQELARCARTQSSCAVLFVHMDSFKRINDTWGEKTGNTILRETASRLMQNTRTEDFVGRYGGANFVLLLVETDLAGAMQVAERVRLAIVSQQYNWKTDEKLPVTTMELTVSIGIAAYRLHGSTRENLIQQAAAAMYLARKSGRNRVRVADIDNAGFASATEKDESDEESTINALTAAASAHHLEMGKHAHRMVALAEETAREMGCSEHEIRLLRLSSLLHDIGKIGIPDAILDKPGPLTKEEWEIMRLHPQIGQQILQQAGGIFAVLAHIIVAHHERWDGQGYPLGLAQQDIPIEARILSVADAFDAMISQRVYRQPISLEEARMELLRCAGSQFDPEVVVVFLRIVQRSEQELVPVLEELAMEGIGATP